MIKALAGEKKGRQLLRGKQYMPVSYTHLDVYKRQQEETVARNTEDGESGTMRAYTSRLEGWTGIAVESPFSRPWMDQDVYKRQSMSWKRCRHGLNHA